MSRSERRAQEAAYRKREAALAKMNEVLMADMAADRLSGAGLPIDRFLRKIVDSVNNTSFGATSTKPMMEVVGPLQNFLTSKKAWVHDNFTGDMQYAAPCLERNHAFHLDDFFDVLTADGFPDGTEAAASLDEGVIHHYSSLDNPHELTFADGTGNQFAVSGFSMIRHGGRLTWMLLGGPIVDMDAVHAENAKRIELQDPYGRKLKPARPAPLPGTDDVWYTVVAGEFDLRRKAHDVRIVVRVESGALSLTSDHPDFQHMNPALLNEELIEGSRRQQMEEVNKLAALFDLAEGCFGLPAYFKAKVHVATSVERDSAFAAAPAGEDKARALKARSQIKSKAYVTSLDVERPERVHGTSVSYSPPRFRVEVNGYWRRLSPGAAGKDSDGAPTVGRTWVKSHERWRDRPERPDASSSLRIKSRISDALEAAAMMRDADPDATARVTFG